LLHSNPAQLSLPAPPPSADEERHQQQRRLVAWLEDENADVHYPQPAQLPLVMSTTTTATTTTTTTVTTSRHLEPYAYEELVRYRHRQQQQQQQQLHGSRPVNLWTADAELHTLEVLHSFVDVYHHHIWISWYTPRMPRLWEDSSHSCARLPCAVCVCDCQSHQPGLLRL
jgi:hypothetical protein